MKNCILAAMSLAFAVGSVQASQQLASAKNCMACHTVDKKLVGPSFKEIAGRYGKDAGAQAKVASKIRQGGSGAWGPVPMPANAQVSEAEAAQLAAWVLATR